MLRQLDLATRSAAPDAPAPVNSPPSPVSSTPSARARATSCSAQSRIAGSSATNGTLRAAGTNPTHPSTLLRRSHGHDPLRPTTTRPRTLRSRHLHKVPDSPGSCNDYDYVCGDAVNGSDLSGEVGGKGSRTMGYWRMQHRNYLAKLWYAAASRAAARSAGSRQGHGGGGGGGGSWGGRGNNGTGGGARNIVIGGCYGVCVSLTISRDIKGGGFNAGIGVGGLGSPGGSVAFTHSNRNYCGRQDTQLAAGGTYGVGAYGSVGIVDTGEHAGGALEIEDWEAGLALGSPAGQLGPMHTPGFLNSC